MGKNSNKGIRQYFDLLPRRVIAWLLIDHLVRHGIVPAKGLLKDIYAYALYSRRLKVSKSHPLYNLIEELDPGAYALGNATLIWLWEYICKTRPRCIVEMGSGKSTLVLAMYAQKVADEGKSRPKIISIESDKYWLSKTQGNLDKSILPNIVNFMHCEVLGNNNKNAHGYDIDYERLDKLLDGKFINLLLIDGPSGGHGRGGTLPSLAERLAVNAEVLLDDASRDTEKGTIKKWLDNYKNHLTLYGVLPLGNGLALFHISRKIGIQNKTT